MEVTSIRVEAFKSLYEVECKLDHFTVITGPNGAGKSNLVDALNFLGEVYAHGLEFALARAGGFENVAHRRSRRAKKPISFTVEVQIPNRDLRRRGRELVFGDEEDDIHEIPVPAGMHFTYRHHFAFKTTGQRVLADFVVETDCIEILSSAGEVLFKLERVGDQVEYEFFERGGEADRVAKRALNPYGSSRYREVIAGQPLSPTELVMEQTRFSNILWDVKQALRRIRVFQLSPHEVRGPGVSTPNAALERHGENLPGAADHLRRNEKRAWDKIQQAMRAIMPNLDEIEVAFTEDRRLSLQFRERVVGRPWNTGEVSDGTIQALALFVALFDGRSPVLAIEEPENSIHPWILRQFIDLCLEQRTKQIIMTTHSPVLLDYVKPESIRLMSISRGRSLIRRFTELSPEIAELTLSGEISMFDAYDSGVIPESVPQGFMPGQHISENEDGE